MTECLTFQSTHPTLLDDEMAALALQLDEIGLYYQSGKGKYAVDHPPDSEIAYADFRAELRNYKTFLADMPSELFIQGLKWVILQAKRILINALACSYSLSLN